MRRLVTLSPVWGNVGFDRRLVINTYRTNVPECRPTAQITLVLCDIWHRHEKVKLELEDIV